jgi:DNA-binding CsgD family transcriptional regulator
MSERRDSSRHSGNQGGPAAAREAWESDTQRGLDLLLALSECLRSWRSFAPGSERLLRDLAGGLGHAAGALWLPDDEALVARAVWSSSAIQRSALEAHVSPMRVARGTGLAGHAWMHAEPVTSESVPADGLPEVSGLRGALGIPALSGSGVVCVFELYSTGPSTLSKRMTEVLGAVARQLGDFFARRRGELDSSPLTARELEVLTLAAIGLPVTSIGQRLTISRGTVKSHLEHIYSKLGVVNRTAAVAHALRTGLIE